MIDNKDLPMLPKSEILDIKPPVNYPLETQAEFALRILVIKGWVTQEKVDRVMKIAAKFNAHLPKET